MIAASWSRSAGVRPAAIADPHAVPRVTQSLFVLAVLLLFTVSGGMLWLFGYNYDGLTGNPATKIHPGTYLTFLVFLLAALQDGNPVRFAARAGTRHPAGVFLFAVALLMFLQILMRGSPGLAGSIDTDLLPPVAVALVATSDRTTRERLEIVIHVAMIANAVLGLVEFGTRHLVFPYRFDGEVYPMDTRSTALQGHPLGNATVTAIYVLALVAGGGRFAAPLRAGVIVLEAMALVAFGGRSAIVTVAVLATGAGVVGLVRLLRSGRVPLLGLGAAVLVATAAPLVVGGLAVSGFFDAILMRFSADGGSANTRVEMFALLARIPLRDLMIGPDIGLVESLRRVSGLEMGIENPIVRTVLYQGLILATLLVLAVGLFLAEVARACRRGWMLPMLGFLIVVNTFESLASKTTMLAKFAIMLLVLFPRERGPGSRPAGRNGSATPVR